MGAYLGTTNFMLGVIAAVSVLQALVVISVGVGAYMVYRRIMDLLNGLEERQIAPAMARVNAILDDVKSVSAKVKEEAELVDQAVRAAVECVDATAGRVRSTLHARAIRIIGILRGARVAIETILSHSRAA